LGFVNLRKKVLQKTSVLVNMWLL